jgi:hypothetical protein
MGAILLIIGIVLTWYIVGKQTSTERMIKKARKKMTDEERERFDAAMSKKYDPETGKEVPEKDDEIT